MSLRCQPLSSWEWIRATCRPSSRSSGRAGPVPPIVGRPPRSIGGDTLLRWARRRPVTADSRPTLRHTVCRWMTRGPLGPPVSAHVMRGEHTLLRASSLLPGLAPGLGGLPPVRRAPAAVDALPRVGRLCALASPVRSAAVVGVLVPAAPPGGCLSVRPGPTLMAGLTAPRCAPALVPALVGSHYAPASRAPGSACVCSPSLRPPPACLLRLCALL